LSLNLSKQGSAAMLAAFFLSTLAVSSSSRAENQPSASSQNNFDLVFSAKGEPRWMHFHANYVGKTGSHRLELWRDNQKEVRRRTDDNTDAYVTHSGLSEDWSMVILDHRKKMSAKLDRQTLMKMGTFTDWFDLSHGLIRPFGPHQVKSIEAPSDLAEKPIEACKWAQLSQKGAGTVRVCWSQKYHLPLMMTSEDKNQVVWKITDIETKAISKMVFKADLGGYNQHDTVKDLMDD
jgi:hypothetical protein